VHVLAADLAAARRENAALRRRIVELQAEVDRLLTVPLPAARTARRPAESRPVARVAERS